MKIFWLLSIASALAVPAAEAAEDCTRYLDAPKVVAGRPVGIKSCTASDPKPIKTADGKPFVRLEIGVSGTLDGFTVKEGPRYEMLTDLPDFALAQRQNLGPYFRGTGYYSADKGNLITILMPEKAADWNGKMYVLVHGMSSYGKLGELQPRVAGKYNPLMNDNEFAGLMIDKGYVVVHTSRPAARQENGASEIVVLSDGTEMKQKSFGYNSSVIKDWTTFAQKVVKEKLGKNPEKTYYYGKSAGASLGRLINYVPGYNVGADGKRMFDGFIIDDAGGGWCMPTLNFRRVEDGPNSFHLEVDAQDHLPFDQKRIDEFAPQIDVVHQAYVGADFVEGNYLQMKRLNSVLLEKKGVGDKARTYEIVGLSHGDAGNVFPNPRYKGNIDQSGTMDSFIDMLDGWVGGTLVPPPSRSDDFRVGDVNGDRVLDHPAIQLPEVACPLGQYYEFPEGVKDPGETGFAPYLRTRRPALNADTTPLPAGFLEEWLEPLDSRGRPLDMNGNHVRDTRETIEEAWKRRRVEGEQYGVLDADDFFTPERYAVCVMKSASELADAGLLSKAALFHYVEQAMSFKMDGEASGEAPSPKQ